MTIKDVMKNYERALHSSSTEDVMKLYGENPIFMPQNSLALEGREAVKKGYDRIFDTIRLNAVFTLHEATPGFICASVWSAVTSAAAICRKTLTRPSIFTKRNIRSSSLLSRAKIGDIVILTDF